MCINHRDYICTRSESQSNQHVIDRRVLLRGDIKTKMELDPITEAARSRCGIFYRVEFGQEINFG